MGSDDYCSGCELFEMKKPLEGKRCYISGAIDKAKDTQWVYPVKNELERRFNLDLFIPHIDPKQQWVDKLKECKKLKDFDSVTEIASKFQRKDLCLVDRSDLLIVRWEKDIQVCGTCHEMFKSIEAKKPTLLVCEDGLEEVPGWLFPLIKWRTNMFEAWDKLYEYLDNVNDGLEIDNLRWAFIYETI